MNSSNSAGPVRNAAPKSTFSYLFPDIAEVSSSRVDNIRGGDDFIHTHFQEGLGGFYELMHPSRKSGEKSRSAAEAAEVDAEAIRKKAYEEGFCKAEADARALVEKDFSSMFAAFHKALAELDRLKKELESSAEKDAVKLAFAIAQKIVYHELAAREETIFELVHEALKQVPDWKSAVIRVSPSDYERIKQKTAVFSDDPDALEELRMQPDPSISDGDCIIDTPFGMIDARVEKRLQAVEAALASRLACK